MEVIMFKTTKRDLIFFDLFSVVMDDTCKAADLLHELFSNYTDIDDKIQAIEKLEHSCDRAVHDIMEHLNRSFVTPIDREDIFVIAKNLDNIIDNIEETAQSLKLFSITKIKPESIEMAELITNSTKVLSVVVSELKHFKTSKIMHPKIIEVNHIENQGDEAYYRIIQDLFNKEQNPLEVIKWKDIIENMESTLDACEDVANTIEGVVSKNV
jgi:hypothetical protein